METQINDIISNYGVILKRLTHDKIELVRRWRNDPKISQYMEYRKEITPEMQEKWFMKINNDNNLYYIIEFEGKEVGLINVKDIDYNKKEGEGGIFIWDDSCLNSDIGYRSSCALSDYIYTDLGLEKTIAHILTTNKRAVKYNKSLGFVETLNQNEILNRKWVQTRDQFLNSKARKIIYKYYNQ